MSEHDFKGALTGVNACLGWYDDKIGEDKRKAIQAALRIADRLQSADMTPIVEKVIKASGSDIKHYTPNTKIKMLSQANVGLAQIIKETSDERTKI